jgi:hypothetical protein
MFWTQDHDKEAAEGLYGRDLELAEGMRPPKDYDRLQEWLDTLTVEEYQDWLNYQLTPPWESE